MTKVTPTQWYSDRPMGINSLRDMVKHLACTAGLQGKFMNYSLRATSATRMYDAGVPEKHIKEVPGHKSDAVCTYERTSEKMKCKVSATLSKPTEIDLSESPHKEKITSYKKLKPNEHPLLQCLQSSGIQEYVESVLKESVKSVKVHIEIECHDK